MKQTVRIFSPVTKGLFLIALMASVIVIMMALSGCSAIESKHPLLDKQESYRWVTNTATEYKTNTVVQQITNDRWITNLQVQLIQVPIPVCITNVEFVPSKSVQTVETTGATVAQFLPAPIGGILSTVLGIGGLAIGLYGKILSGKYKTVIRAVAAGVEVAGTDEVKSIIQGHATIAGVQHLLDPIVQEVSKNLPDTEQTIVSKV